MTAKEMMRKGVERTEIVRLMKLHPKFHEDFLATARRSDARRLSAALEKLAATDLAIKTSKGGGGTAGARLQLEMLVLEMLNL